MLIEHDGKRIDTERELRRKDTHMCARYVGSLRDDRHIFEWGKGSSCGRWDVYTKQGAVEWFENVPQKHVRWVVVYDGFGWDTREAAEADRQAFSHIRNTEVVRIEWES